MSDVINFDCPHCGQNLEAPPDMAGESLACPSCGRALRIPGASPPAPAVPRSCPVCKSPLAPESVVCVQCGLDLRTGKRLTTESPSGVPAPLMTLGQCGPRRKTETLSVSDFVAAAWSERTRSYVTYLWLAVLGYTFLSLFPLGIVMCLVAIAVGARTPGLEADNILARAALGAVKLMFVVQPFLSLYCAGGVWKHVLAACEASCHDVAMPRVDRYSNWGAALRMLAVVGIPVFAFAFLVMVLPDAAPPAVILILSLVFFAACSFCCPIAFLSLAEAQGNLAGLHPTRVLRWIRRLAVPYLGVWALVVADTVVLLGLGVAVVFLPAALLFGAGEVAAMLGSPLSMAQRGLGNVVFGLVSFLLLSVIAVHPQAYAANVLGMLYRKYGSDLD